MNESLHDVIHDLTKQQHSIAEARALKLQEEIEQLQEQIVELQLLEEHGAAEATVVDDEGWTASDDEWVAERNRILLPHSAAALAADNASNGCDAEATVDRDVRAVSKDMASFSDSSRSDDSEARAPKASVPMQEWSTRGMAAAVPKASTWMPSNPPLVSADPSLTAWWRQVQHILSTFPSDGLPDVNLCRLCDSSDAYVALPQCPKDPYLEAMLTLWRQHCRV